VRSIAVFLDYGSIFAMNACKFGLFYIRKGMTGFINSYFAKNTGDIAILLMEDSIE
jgi:hypothetical protein